jgi:hypothetical protein
MSIHLPRADFLTAIRKAGLSGGLKLCLDAGHEDSLPAASARWNDISGNGHNFFRGTSAGSESSDPTIVGVAGRRSSGEYLSFDGGDRLTYDGTNASWMQDWHKATGVGGFQAWFYLGNHLSNSAVANIVATANHNGTQVGVVLGVTGVGGTTRLCSHFKNGTGTPPHGPTSYLNTELNPNSWNFITIAFDHNRSAAADNTWFTIGCNNLNRSVTNVAASSFSTSNASQTMTIGGLDTILPSGCRLGAIAMWGGYKPTREQHLAMFHLTRSKYGV